MASSNGSTPHGATAAADRLVRKNYGDRVLASIGESRMITDRYVRAMIGEFNPDAVSIRDLRRMRRDTMIKMGLHYSKAPLIRAEWTIECEDPAIQAAMTEIVRDAYQPWMRTALNMFDFGYQGAVKQYELGKIDATFEDPDSGNVRPVWDEDAVQPVVLGPLIPIPPEYARVKLDKGRFDGIDTSLVPFAADASDEQSVPLEWSLWFTNEFEEEFRDYYGTSRILPAYEPWFAYWFTHHMRSRHVEMDADPALQVWYPPGTYEDPNDLDENGKPRVKSNRDAALLIGAQLRGGATIAWPSDVYYDEQGKATPIRLWEAAFLTGGENLSAFNEVLGDLEMQKLRACLVPEEALVAHTGGLNSGGKVASYGQIFTESLEMTATYLDSLWNKHQLRPIVEANWGKDAPACRKVTTGFQEEDMTLAIALIEAAFNADPNALPIKFEELLKRAGLPVYTASEQQEREQAQADAQAEQQAQQEEAAAAAGGTTPPGAPAAGGGAVGPLPGESQTPQSLAASQNDRRSKPRKYEREHIHLSSKTAKGVAPSWAQREGRRRDRNVAALAERLHDVVEARYRDVFDAAAEALAGLDETDLLAAVEETADLNLSVDLELALGDKVRGILNDIVGFVKRRVEGYRRPLEGELAGMYHAAGTAELSRLGLSADSWDVGRDEVQEWARFRAGELIKTIDKTVVEQHLRPWLATELQRLGQQDSQGLPIGGLELAQRLTEKFGHDYPLWMAERVVRSEARMGYNESAADMWERIGIEEVEEYDGLGGRTGKTDEECLARNGQRVSIDQFRADNRAEHPNGTLGAVPITTDVELKPLNPGVVLPDAVASLSIYGITDAGLILSEEETGRALAGE